MRPYSSSYNIAIASADMLLRRELTNAIAGVAGLCVAGEASNQCDLLALLNTPPPSSDIVVLDTSMLDFRGDETIRLIKMQFPDVKILVLTASSENFHQAMTAGVDGCMPKEDAGRNMISAIEIVRNGGKYLPPDIMEMLVRRRVAPQDPLSVREKEILRLLAEGKTNREAAEALFISVRTAESHRARIMRKLNLKNTADLVKYAIQGGYSNPSGSLPPPRFLAG